MVQVQDTGDGNGVVESEGGPKGMCMTAHAHVGGDPISNEVRREQLDFPTANPPAGTPLATTPQMTNNPNPPIVLEAAPAMERASSFHSLNQDSEHEVLADMHLTLEQGSDYSSDIDFICGGKATPKASILPPQRPTLELLWLSKGRSYILNHQEGLDVPFPKASNAFLHHLKEVEKTKGGPRNVLTKLMDIGNEAFSNKTARVFDSDTEGLDGETDPGDSDYGNNEASHNLLECTRRVMVLQAKIQEHTTNRVLATSNEIPAENTQELSTAPPGGVLVINGPPDKDIPPRSALCIEDYSNSVYWQYAPYLDTVCLASWLRLPAI
jgi:hypothetical protein